MKSKQSPRKKAGQSKRKTQPFSVKRSAPIAISSQVRNSPARIQGGKNGSITISKKEFVGSYTTVGAGFVINPLCLVTPGLDLNPAATQLFPWLSNIAGNYERYRFTNFKFHVIPSSNTTISGRQYVAIDYDYDDVPASTKAGIMGNKTAVESAVWQEVTLEADPRELNRDMPFRYVSAGQRMNAVEPRTAFSGFLMFATDSPTPSLIFDFWVEYTVVLEAPVLDSNTGVDNFTGLTAPAATTVLPAVGTGFSTFYGGAAAAPVNNVMGVVPGSPIADVIAGTAAVPQLAQTINGTVVTAARALDLAGAAARGTLSLINKFNVTASTPTTVAATGASPSAAIFDSKGAYLGDLTTTAIKAVRAVSAELNTAWATAGANLIATALVTLPNIYAVYSTARYLVPYINSGTTLGAGTMGFGYKYEL